MKRSLMLLGNIVIVLVILGLILFNVSSEQKNLYSTRSEAFGNMTVATGNVTTNYLLGEQQICNGWATYINANDMSIGEAIEFVRKSIFTPDITAHILLTGNNDLTGLSTSGRNGQKEDYPVSYNNVGIFKDGFATQFKEDGKLNVTRAYTNPVNAIQSISFCCPVTLRDEQTGQPQSAVLLRVVPVSFFESRWVFPTEEYDNAEISLIDTSGDYIVRGNSFKNMNFYEFYQAYNRSAPTELESMKNRLEGTPGNFEMTNASGERCLAAHARVNSTDDWIIVTMIPASGLGRSFINWTIVVIITVGLLLLLAFNLLIMMYFNRKLKAAVDSADKANRAKTDFLSSMSHDIRTPMNAIVGLSLLTEKNADDPTIVRENLQKMNRASNHLLTLINDILDISKVESGKLNMSPVTFSIVECAENLVTISQPMVKEKNIDFRFHIDRVSHEYLYADQLRINQIFINLLSNSIKYTEPGGQVCVEMKEEPGQTDKSVQLIYTVSDNGIGMTPEFMAKMYEPFSRQTDSRVNAISGTGLGLAITKQMIDLMNGTIDCQSEAGKGTTFTVKLEITIADRQMEEMKLPPIRVLIADDDEVLLETAKDTLSSIGVKADIARSGAEAIQMISDSADYQVMILDWKMPDMDGIEVTRRLRKEAHNDIPIILISAYDYSDIESAAKEAGISGYICKPLFCSTLYNKINEVLGNKSAPVNPDSDLEDFTGMRILVAEDNDINWEIISNILEMHGIETERAENGQLVLDRINDKEKAGFDLIFMDIQMPVMNGLNATKAIRSLDDPEIANIPIIAMTADAFSENVSECLAAGMNGHISKPIDIKLVMKEIRKIREEKQNEK
ncbi:MAG: response regulator [Clostridiales bacterium]|nr:response regulator [Clostridiales bacterium]